MNKAQRIRVTAVVKNKNKILLLYRPRSIKTREILDIWEFPSGTIEFGETPEQAINREVKEETGLKAKNKGFLTVGSCGYNLGGEEIHEIVIAYLFKTQEYEVDLSQREREHSQFNWVSFNDLEKIPNLALTAKCILSFLKKHFKF